MLGSGDGLSVGEPVGGTIVSTVTNRSMVRVVGALVAGGGGGDGFAWTVSISTPFVTVPKCSITCGLTTTWSPRSKRWSRGWE